MKKAFRNSVLRSLRTLTEDRRVNSDRAVAVKIEHWCQTLPKGVRLSCALFWGMGHEIKTQAIDKQLKSYGFTRLYPRVQDRRMSFHEVPADLGGANMEKGPFGIPQPPLDWPEAHFTAIDLVFVPAIGVTAQGARLGQGGGFYDRFMSLCRQEQAPPPFVALVLDEQILDDLPTDSWDQPIDGILSPRCSKWITNPRSFCRNGVINLLPQGL